MSKPSWLLPINTLLLIDRSQGTDVFIELLVKSLPSYGIVYIFGKSTPLTVMVHFCFIILFLSLETCIKKIQ